MHVNFHDGHVYEFNYNTKLNLIFEHVFSIHAVEPLLFVHVLNQFSQFVCVYDAIDAFAHVLKVTHFVNVVSATQYDKYYEQFVSDTTPL